MGLSELMMVFVKLENSSKPNKILKLEGIGSCITRKLFFAAFWVIVHIPQLPHSVRLPSYENYLLFNIFKLIGESDL